MRHREGAARSTSPGAAGDGVTPSGSVRTSQVGTAGSARGFPAAQGAAPRRAGRLKGVRQQHQPRTELIPPSSPSENCIEPHAVEPGRASSSRVAPPAQRRAGQVRDAQRRGQRERIPKPKVPGRPHHWGGRNGARGGGLPPRGMPCKRSRPPGRPSTARQGCRWACFHAHRVRGTALALLATDHKDCEISPGKLSSCRVPLDPARGPSPCSIRSGSRSRPETALTTPARRPSKDDA